MDRHFTPWPSRLHPYQRLNDSFFDVFLWQQRTPDSPLDGGLSSTSMPFYDRVGPGGADLAVGGYHRPKGVQGMERHTGEVFWFGNPAGGESIGFNTPVFSNDGTVVYVTNDATAHPAMAFNATAELLNLAILSRFGCTSGLSCYPEGDVFCWSFQTFLLCLS